MRIKIISDSTCDLPQDLIARYDITIAPLNVIRDGENFQDGITITPADVFAHVASGGSLCSTAAVSVGDYQDLFEKYSKEYDGVVHINIGSGFSACHQNALLAAEDYDNVVVIDSRLLSSGQGMVVLEACRLADQGLDLRQIEKALKDFVSRVEISFVLDRLDYMVKGGRCSTAAALGANLLNLKPCIEVVDGRMTVVKKYRGSFEKCLATYVKDRLGNREDLDKTLLFMTHTDVSDGSIHVVREAVKGYGFETVVDSVAGCTVSCHCGPGTLGIIYLKR